MAIKTQLGAQRHNNRMDKIWESAQKAIKETEKILNPVTCESCGKTYDYYTEPAEVKEGGTHVCPECWATDE